MKQQFNPEIWLVEKQRFYPEHWLNKRKPRNKKNTSTTDMNLTDQVETVLKELNQSKIDLTYSYELWLKIGFSFAHEFGEAGREYFHIVSKNYPGYKREETDKQFDKCINRNKSGITIKSFFKAAKDAGININFKYAKKKKY